MVTSVLSCRMRSASVTGTIKHNVGHMKGRAAVEKCIGTTRRRQKLSMNMERRHNFADKTNVTERSTGLHAKKAPTLRRRQDTKMVKCLTWAAFQDSYPESHKTVS